MLLENIIKNLPIDLRQIKINGLALDSRKVKTGNLFFAIKGQNFNGENFIKEAINNGAKAIICNNKSKLKSQKVPLIKVSNVHKKLVYACQILYKKKPRNIIAVTGTNGKTSVADFFYQTLSLCKIPVASIGTLGIKNNKKIKTIGLTSPDIISLHKELYLLKKNRIDNVIIEASSHGLSQGRLDGLNFQAGIFTNFSQDHLDYHKNMKNYFNSKMILFSKLMKKNKYIITDSRLKIFPRIKKIAKNKKLKVLDISSYTFLDKIKLDKIIGSFQKKNILMSLIAAKICGINFKKIKKIIKYLSNVNGRLELCKILPNKSRVFIDYAHTPEGLYTAIKSLKDHHKKKITLIFGCGGDRDKKKRALMANVAKQMCQKIYVTDDNPRNENPAKIRNSIVKNLKQANYFEIGNRKKAIQKAIKNSEQNEIILIAGKGHELYQNYGKKIIKISDKEIIKKIKIKNYKKNKVLSNSVFNEKILNKTLNKKLSIKFNGVSINSKEIKKNNLFVAIKGKRYDGNDYAFEALKKGAKCCIISKDIATIKKKNKIRFNKTKFFLNKFALNKRQYSDATIIAVTGSAGKTTVKTILGKVLNQYGETFFSPKSYNNHYGVPLSLSNLEKNHLFGVFEIGMSKKGEINRLSKIVKPNIAVITNISEAHIENFKNIKEIAKAKGEIINNIETSGTIILNRDDKFYNFFNFLARKKKLNIISFGLSKKADIYPVNIKNSKNETSIKIKAINENIILKMKNINVLNILIITAVLKILKLDVNKVQNFFKKLQPLEGRGKFYKIKRYNTNFKLIDESYNANPLSMKNAILNFSNLKKNNNKKYLLLGDMLELGKKSHIYHKKMSKIINNTDIDKLFVYGKNILETYKYTKRNKQGKILRKKNDFDKIFSKLIKKNDNLMIKGSNGTGLYRLSKLLIKGKNNVI